MQHQLGEAYPAFLAELHAPLPTGIRFNPLKPLSPAEQRTILQQLQPGDWHPVPWQSGAYWTVGAALKPGLHPGHDAGLFYVQDPSAMAPAAALAAKPDERIIDLAAAPGGKATQLAAAVGRSGTVIANEIDETRAKVLMHNIERLGAANTIITSERTSVLAAKWPGAFDRVMLDAPCSGEGMLKKHPEAARQWTEKLVSDLASLQRTLLEDAATLVAPGGVVCYSTCTFSPEENELLIEAFLRDYPNFTCIPTHAPSGAAIPTRLWPHTHPGEGQFLVLLQRSNNDATAPPRNGDFNRHVAAPKADLQRAWQAFAEETFTPRGLEWLAPYTLVAFRGKLLALPPGWLPSSGIRVVRAGLQLGELRGKRFVPHHALASAAPAAAVKRTIALTGAELRAYLRGETFAGTVGAGYGVAVASGGSLGWFRTNRGEVRSLYPHGLRRDILASTTH